MVINILKKLKQGLPIIIQGYQYFKFHNELTELKNLIKDANIPCPENSITAIMNIININFLFFSKNSIIYFQRICYLYKYNIYNYPTCFDQPHHPKLV